MFTHFSKGVVRIPGTIIAIELRSSGAFKDSLDTWDCDCIVVMNPDVIEEV